VLQILHRDATNETARVDTREVKVASPTFASLRLEHGDVTSPPAMASASRYHHELQCNSSLDRKRH
jgi:hypothetical protein